MPAQVIVEKGGFTQDSSGTGTAIAYGLVLINQSTSADAVDVRTTVKFTDTLGRTVVSSSPTVSVIPAAARFYLGGRTHSNVSLTVASFEATVRVEASRPKRIVLPPVTGVAVSPNVFDGIDVTGQLTNRYSKPLPAAATIHAVLFDDHGLVVGGGNQPTLAEVQPGASVGFHFDYFDLYPTTGGVSAQVSVDPCGGFSFDCPVLGP